MNILKGCLSTFYIPILLILGAIIGFILPTTRLWWSKEEIDTQDIDIKEIMLVDYNYEFNSLAREAKDTIYIETIEGQLYAFNLEHETWQRIEPYHDGSIERLTGSYNDIVAITSEGKTLLLHDNQWEPHPNGDEYRLTNESNSCWVYPPVQEIIIDSEGGIGERPLMTETICFVLLENGRLQYWYHQINFFTMMFSIGISTLLGVIAGAISSFYIRKRMIKNSKRELTQL